MSSFKLQSGGSAKGQARSAGMFAMLIGTVCAFAFHPATFIIAGLGLLFFLASFAASE